MTHEERMKAALEALSGCTIHRNSHRDTRKASSFKPRSHDRSHFSGRTWSQCEKKRAYEGSREAQRVAGRIFAERGVRLRVYQCKRCGKYHLTKKTDD